MKNKKDILTIGSDPEFAIVNKVGQTIPAHEVIKTNTGGEFGLDGNPATAELRTKPSKTPKDQVMQIKAILERNKKKYPNVYRNNLFATSQYIPVGGHIHLGHPLLTVKNHYRQPLISKMVYNLDYLLAFPSMFLEKEKDHLFRRINYSYGKLSKYRIKSWGFEYRTLSSYIASRELTSIMFHLSYAIAEATMYNKLKCKVLSDNESFNYCYNHHATELFKPHLNSVFEKLKLLPRYQEATYKRKTDKFISMVKHEIPAYKTEIKKGWNIEFNIADYWHVDKIETLIEKIAKLLISIHSKKQGKFTGTTFAKGSFKDLGCPEIADSVNRALNELIDKDVIESLDIQPIEIRGLRGSRGNKVWIGRCGINMKKKIMLIGTLKEIAKEFRHKTRISEISYKSLSNANFTISFGRKLRKENLLVAEAMTIVLLLILNRDLYKQSEKIKGKNKRLLTTRSKIVKPIVNVLKDVKSVKVKPPLNSLPKKLGRVEFPYIFDFNKTHEELVRCFNSLTEQDKKEISILTVKKLKKIQPLLDKGCTKAFCRKNYLKIKEYCPYHIARYIYTLSRDYLNAYVCDNCTNGNDICDNCDKCRNCCSCIVCSSCDGRFYDDDFCGDCDRCGECCTCNNY